MAELTQQSSRKSSALVRVAQAHPLTFFFLLAYSFSWTMWFVVPHFVRHGKLGANFDNIDLVLIVTGACGPTVAAFVIRWLTHHDFRICSLWTGWRSLIAGLAVGLAGFFLATVVVPAVLLVNAPGSIYAIHWPALLHWSTYALNYSTFFGGPVNEEPGWRGYALPQLQDRFGPYGASIILAMLWAAWHLPLLQIPGWISTAPWQFALILIGISFLFTAAANAARFGVLVAIVLHAFFNTSSRLVNALTQGVPTRANDQLVYTLAIFGSGVILGTVLIRYLKRASQTRAG